MDQIRSRPLDKYDVAVVLPLMDFVRSGYENWTCIDEGLSDPQEEALERLVYAGLYAKRHSAQLWLRDHELLVNLTFEYSGGWHRDEPNDLEHLVREVLNNLPRENADEEVPVSNAILQIHCSSARLTTDGERRRFKYAVSDWPKVEDVYDAIRDYVCNHSTRDTAVLPIFKVCSIEFIERKAIHRASPENSQTANAEVPSSSNPEGWPPMDSTAKNLRFGKYVDGLIEQNLTWEEVVRRGREELGIRVSSTTYRNAHKNYWRVVKGKEPPHRTPGRKSSSK
jgi:hypothetical protein